MTRSAGISDRVCSCPLRLATILLLLISVPVLLIAIVMCARKDWRLTCSEPRMVVGATCSFVVVSSSSDRSWFDSSNLDSLVGSYRIRHDWTAIDFMPGYRPVGFGFHDTAGGCFELRDEMTIMYVNPDGSASSLFTFKERRRLGDFTVFLDERGGGAPFAFLLIGVDEALGSRMSSVERVRLDGGTPAIVGIDIPEGVATHWQTVVPWDEEKFVLVGRNYMEAARTWEYVTLRGNISAGVWSTPIDGSWWPISKSGELIGWCDGRVGCATGLLSLEGELRTVKVLSKEIHPMFGSGGYWWFDGSEVRVARFEE